MSENGAGTLTIIVVEEQDDARLLLKRWLETSGYRVVTALSEGEAIRRARVERPALILVDEDAAARAGLPSDVCALEQLESGDDVPVLALCATLGGGSEEVRVGRNRYVARLDNLDQLEAIIERLLAASQDT